MRDALLEMAETAPVSGPTVAEEPEATLEQRIEAVEEVVREVREVVEQDGKRLEENEGMDKAPVLGGRVAEPGKWEPTERAYGLPRPGVVTLEPQPDEAEAFG